MKKGSSKGSASCWKKGSSATPAGSSSSDPAQRGRGGGGAGVGGRWSSAGSGACAWEPLQLWAGTNTQRLFAPAPQLLPWAAAPDAARARTGAVGGLVIVAVRLIRPQPAPLALRLRLLLAAGWAGRGGSGRWSGGQCCPQGRESKERAWGGRGDGSTNGRPQAWPPHATSPAHPKPNPTWLQLQPTSTTTQPNTTVRSPAARPHRLRRM